ncbi:hypothetical protein RSAG8_08119, partial [Rhizoctonia solani AG-8 WAC10335]
MLRYILNSREKWIPSALYPSLSLPAVRIQYMATWVDHMLSETSFTPLSALLKSPKVLPHGEYSRGCLVTSTSADLHNSARLTN